MNQKSTRKGGAIVSVGDNPHFSKLKRGEFNALVPSIAEGMMTGAVAARQDKSGTITLIYADNSIEFRACNKDLLTEFEDNFFSVVSFVQAARDALAKVRDSGLEIT